ncbi:hypothetical protein H6P81_010043 [Aristolochia fimbriata]|uniref:ATPase AAA-type core domain-containing protein n=1 Tax=Aristolochia fimbriata TaxID=158543 RepID=A0AAV7ES53_ARIFI|nr:hypothetical protein H6P81_010043 [Aristolochia fimbriata]
MLETDEQSTKQLMKINKRILLFELFGFPKEKNYLVLVLSGSLLDARGGAFEHEATGRMRNEFMAAWDGLRTKDKLRTLILGATNQPFDRDYSVTLLAEKNLCIAAAYRPVQITSRRRKEGGTFCSL